MSTPLVVFTHQGLGDMFLCHGAVRVMADRRPLILLCRRTYVATVAWMYRDHPGISVVACESDRHGFDLCNCYRASGLEVKLMGYLGGDPLFKDLDYDKHFYRQAGVDFECRWSRFHFEPEAVEPTIVQPWPIQNKQLVLVHNDARFVIKELPDFDLANQFQIRMTNDLPNLFDWLPTMRAATAIHCIPSCVYILIDSLKDFPPGITLYLHKHLRASVTYPEHRKNWIIV